MKKISQVLHLILSLIMVGIFGFLSIKFILGWGKSDFGMSGFYIVIIIVVLLVLIASVSSLITAIKSLKKSEDNSHLNQNQ